MVLLTSFLKLPPVKDFNFYFAAVLEIGITGNPSQKNNGLTPLPPVYTLRGDNSFSLNIQSRHTKSVQEDNAEIETSIWNNVAADLFKGGYRTKSHGPLSHHLSNNMDNCFKLNVARRFLRYIVNTYSTSRILWHNESRKE